MHVLSLQEKFYVQKKRKKRKKKERKEKKKKSKQSCDNLYLWTVDKEYRKGLNRKIKDNDLRRGGERKHTGNTGDYISSLQRFSFKKP